MKTRHHHSIRNEAFIGLTLLLLTVVGGTAWLTRQTPKPNSVKQLNVPSQVGKPPVLVIPNTPVPSVKEQITIPKTTQTLAPKVNSTTTQLKPQAYWLKLEDKSIRLVPQPVIVKEQASPDLALKAAINNLLSSHETSSLTTTIPAGTKLLDLRIAKKGIYVNLSDEFSSGGGSTSMIYRVAQVLYTATSLDPNAKVFISVEGQLLDENYPLGGEGIILGEPLTRKQFAEDFSIS